MGKGDCCAYKGEGAGQERAGCLERVSVEWVRDGSAGVLARVRLTLSDRSQTETRALVG